MPTNTKNNTVIPHPENSLPMLGVSIDVADPQPGQIVNLTGQPANVARYGVVRMKRNPDGSYTPIVKTYTRWIKFSPAMMVELHLHNVLSKETIRRLIDCGVVDASHPSPGITLIDVDSLLSHIERTRDGDWWTPERARRYRLGLPMGDLK